MEHRFSVQVYYEDTDHSGLVYHANYLKYFERAREHVLGVTELVRLLNEDGIGFVVYKAELTYKKGAVFGDAVTVVTEVARESDYRLGFRQDAYRPAPSGGEELLVQGRIDLVCVDRAGQLTRVPASVMDRL